MATIAEVATDYRLSKLSPVEKPVLGELFEIDKNVLKGKSLIFIALLGGILCLRSRVEALPIPGSKVEDANVYGKSLWSRTTKIVCRTPGGANVAYFHKVSEASRLWGQAADIFKRPSSMR